ncbi:unnamed protein product [Ambrosiozyma monospora]|uniref:Unnamed protein product n=1 Tax=Ambrosiozyma monospora TaxID=43982 RepID=A0A9W7DDQ2_AMBMO|nr:unnamed protein product [Ambrosiozyma monospora]
MKISTSLIAAFIASVAVAVPVPSASEPAVASTSLSPIISATGESSIDSTDSPDDPVSKNVLGTIATGVGISSGATKAWDWLSNKFGW